MHTWDLHNLIFFVCSTWSLSLVTTTDPEADRFTHPLPQVANLGIKQYLWQYMCWFGDAMERMAGVTFRWVDDRFLHHHLGIQPHQSLRLMIA
jgi:hypothetical protein